MYTLYIGNKNYSSWSLRPWLLMRQAGIAFSEKLLYFDTPEFHAQIGAVNPARRVPCLYDGEFAVWDTLAIGEYLAERHPGLWPSNAQARARARSLCAEMHSGFNALRGEMPMNVRARTSKAVASAALKSDVERVFDIWNDTRRQFGMSGEMLFGAFSIADAFFAPVAFRFQTYGVEPPGAAGAYLRTLLALPAMREWEAASVRETEHVRRVDLVTAAPAQQQ